MDRRWLWFPLVLAGLICGCAPSFAPYNPVDKKLGFLENFEEDDNGTWPCRWIADANATDLSANHIDGATFADTQGKVLRLHGDSPSWSPLAHVKTNIKTPFRVMFDFFVDPATPDATVVAGLRTLPSWTQPGLLLFSAPLENPVRVLEPVIIDGEVLPGQTTNELCIKSNRWYRIDLRVMPEKKRTKMTAVIQDGDTARGPIEFTAEGLVMQDMPYLQLEVRNGTAWFDNISVTPLDWKR